MKKGVRIAIFTIAVIIILALISLVISTFSTETCEDENCFRQNLISCDKTVYESQHPTVFSYNIEGVKNGLCRVNILFKETDQEALNSLVGKEMTCDVQLNVDALPQDDLEQCSGPLKTEIQKEVITKLHKDITLNLQ